MSRWHRSAIGCSLAALVAAVVALPPATGGAASVDTQVTTSARTRASDATRPAAAGLAPAGAVRRVRMLKCRSTVVDEAAETVRCRRPRAVRVLATKDGGRWVLVTPAGGLRPVPYVWSRSRKALVFSPRLAWADHVAGQGGTGEAPRPPRLPETPPPAGPVPRDGGGDPSSFAFDAGFPDDPAHAARWDRCHEIRWAADLSRTSAYGLDPAQVLASITSALVDVSTVTGYTFRYVGRVDGELSAATAFPGAPRADTWAARFDLAVTAGAELDPAGYAFDVLGGGVVGYAQTVYEDFRSDQLRPMELATVVLDAEDLSPSYTGPFPPVGTIAEQLDATVRHEIGHALGLAHVGDETQLMYDTAVEGVYDYANGDRQGLWLLAAQPCMPV